MVSEHFLDTPLLYDGKMINEFIPQKYNRLVKVLEETNWKPEFENLEEKLDDVLDNPVGYTESLEQLVARHYGKHNKILILLDDNTRPNEHTKLLLPLLLPRLLDYGITKEDIHILFACGTHRAPTPAEQKGILGSEIWTEYHDRLLVHDCDKGCIDLGIQSSMGTPIIINEHVITADLVIPITDSELHYFAGVAGTIKELIPGVAARRTVNKNHVRLFDPKLGFKTACRLGNVDGNPVITDIKEMVNKITKKVPIFGIDAIFGLHSREIVYLNAGDLVKLHEAAARRIVALRTVEINSPADIVIVSAKQLGINLYQTGKAIHTAWNAVKRGGQGKIIVLAACRDGVGSASYLQSMDQCKNKSLDQALEFVLAHYCTEETFRIGNQKPVDLIRILQSIGETNIHMITEMDPELLKRTFRINPIRKAPDESVSTVLTQVLADLVEWGKREKEGAPPSIYVIPDPGVLVVQKHQSIFL
ncbi:MAG: lactate racemase domain-containing protein [Candidatus Heimdallarchaeota archaeon]